MAASVMPGAGVRKVPHSRCPPSRGHAFGPSMDVRGPEESVYGQCTAPADGTGIPVWTGPAKYTISVYMERYQAGTHTLRLFAKTAPSARRRSFTGSPTAPLPATSWEVTVDRVPMGTRFASKPDAWTAGVREADRLSRNVQH